MAVTTKTLWNVNSALIGGQWHIDSLRGLLDGVIYVDRFSLEHREPKQLTLRGSRGTEATATNLDGAAVGAVTVALMDDISTSTLVAYKVSSGSTEVDIEGIYQIDALYTTKDSEGGDIDAYTKDEVDKMISDVNTAVNRKADATNVYTKTQADAAMKVIGDAKVDLNAAPKVSKASASSSNVVNKVATDATLAQLITAFNLSVDTLNTVRSTAGSAYTAANGLIDSLTTAKVMAS